MPPKVDHHGRQEEPSQKEYVASLYAYDVMPDEVPDDSERTPAYTSDDENQEHDETPSVLAAAAKRVRLIEPGTHEAEPNPWSRSVAPDELRRKPLAKVVFEGSNMWLDFFSEQYCGGKNLRVRERVVTAQGFPCYRILGHCPVCAREHARNAWTVVWDERSPKCVVTCLDSNKRLFFPHPF